MKTRVHRTVRLAAVGAVAVIAVACQSGDETSPAATSAASTATTPAASASLGLPSSSATASADAASTPSGSTPAQGDETSVFDLEEGDCFGEAGEQVETVSVVDCDESHIYEVFSVFDYEPDADAYPGRDEVRSHADERCEAEFDDFVGIDYQSSRWYITSVTPSEETWADGDREIVCTLNLEDNSEVTGSAEGSGE